jgi:hypothetical protein
VSRDADNQLLARWGWGDPDVWRIADRLGNIAQTLRDDSPDQALADLESLIRSLDVWCRRTADGAAK